MDTTMKGLPKHFDLRHLAIFATVAETRSMAETARRFDITQAAVSQAVARLERAVGLALLDRSTRPFALTAAGTYVERQGREVVGLATGIHRTLGESGRSTVPELRLSLIDSFAGATMPALLARLDAEMRPERVLVQSGLTDRNVAALLEGRVDGVITADSLEMASGLPTRALLRERFVAVAPAGAEEADVAALAQARRFLGFPPASPLGRQVQVHFGRQRLRLDARMVIDRPDLLLPAVADGLGWTVATPLCLAASGVAPGRIRVLRIAQHPATRRLAFMTRPHEMTEANARVARIAAETAAAILPERLAAYAPWLPEEIAFDEGVDAISSP